MLFRSGNILGIGRNKSRSSYFSVTKTESKGETEKSREVATPPLGAGPPGRADPVCGRLVALLRLPCGLRERVGENRTFRIDLVQFREYFQNNFSGIQK